MQSVEVLPIVTLGGAEGTRTPDFLLAKEALSQLSYSPIYHRYYNNKGFSVAIYSSDFILKNIIPLAT